MKVKSRQQKSCIFDLAFEPLVICGQELAFIFKISSELHLTRIGTTGFKTDSTL